MTILLILLATSLGKTNLENKHMIQEIPWETVFSSAPPNCDLDRGSLTLRPLFPVHHRPPFGPCQPTLHTPFPGPVEIMTMLSLRMYLLDFLI